MHQKEKYRNMMDQIAEHIIALKTIREEADRENMDQFITDEDYKEIPVPLTPKSITIVNLITICEELGLEYRVDNYEGCLDCYDRKITCFYRGIEFRDYLAKGD